jgi:hypothetical protein
MAGKKNIMCKNVKVRVLLYTLFTWAMYRGHKILTILTEQCKEEQWLETSVYTDICKTLCDHAIAQAPGFPLRAV